jgi:hypothetical protein
MKLENKIKRYERQLTQCVKNMRTYQQKEERATQNINPFVRRNITRLHKNCYEFFKYRVIIKKILALKWEGKIDLKEVEEIMNRATQ